MPDTDDVCRGQERESERAEQLDCLRHQEQVTPASPIGKNAPKKRKQEDRNLTEEGIQPEIEGRAGKLIDEPALRESLHPSTDARRAGAKPHDPKIGVGECSKNLV
jgi:hypothetical protein